jgi:hypothetical protein
MTPNRKWPECYLQSYLIGVPILILGKRSGNKLTSVERKPMESVLREAEKRKFRGALALGRIHDILSALIRDCETRTTRRPYTKDFMGELQILPKGKIRILPVARDDEAMGELASAWGPARSTSDASTTSTPVASGPCYK